MYLKVVLFLAVLVICTYGSRPSTRNDEDGFECQMICQKPTTEPVSGLGPSSTGETSPTSDSLDIPNDLPSAAASAASSASGSTSEDDRSYKGKSHLPHPFNRHLKEAAKHLVGKAKSASHKGEAKHEHPHAKHHQSRRNSHEERTQHFKNLHPHNKRHDKQKH